MWKRSIYLNQQALQGGICGFPELHSIPRSSHLHCTRIMWYAPKREVHFWVSAGYLKVSWLDRYMNRVERERGQRLRCDQPLSSWGERLRILTWSVSWDMGVLYERERAKKRVRHWGWTCSISKRWSSTEPQVPYSLITHTSHISPSSACLCRLYKPLAIEDTEQLAITTVSTTSPPVIQTNHH